MDAILTALAEQHAELDGLLAPLDAADWARPSACEGWSVADVVVHLAQTDEMALASLDGRLGATVDALLAGLPPVESLDAAVDAMVAKERGLAPPAVYARWSDAAAELRGQLAVCNPRRRVQWVAGELSAWTLATTRLSESWIHTGDVATGLGREREPAARIEHIARLAWRTLPHAFARAGQAASGPVAFHLTGPHGEAWDLEPEAPAATTIRGSAAELCAVASRRVPAAATSLQADGPDADAVLALVRTWA